MRVLLCGLAALSLLSACQDPSTVGTGLIDEDLPSPNVRVLAATAVDTVNFVLPTAGFATTDGGSQVQSRVLVGDVRDALYGDVAAVAYVDARAPSLPSGFADRPVTRVTLELRRSYVYGDTTATVPLEVREVDGSWSPIGLPPDTTLATGDLLATGSLSAADTLVTVQLPDSWVAANADLFGRTSFGTDFEGFEVRTSGTAGQGAVLGFNVAAGSALRVATARDTVAFPLSEVYTRLTSGTPGLAPMGRRLLRGDAGAGVRFAFDFADVLRLPLSQAVFRLPIDRAYSGTDGAFKRPLAAFPALLARPQTGTAAFVSRIEVGATGDGRSVPSASAANAATSLNGIVQSILLDRVSYQGLEVRLQSNPVSLHMLPIVTDGALPTGQPRLSLTVVGA